MAYTFIKRQKAYLDDDELVYELILSKGKGTLTKKCERMLILIADNFSRKFRYYDEDTSKDCYQTGMEMLLKNWKNFNPKKYNKALPYLTEIYKRAAALGLKQYHNDKTRMNVSINKWHTLGSSW